MVQAMLADTTDELGAQGRAAYQAIDDAGVSVNPQAFRNKTDEIVDFLRSGGLDEGGGALNLTPKSARVAELLGEASEDVNTIPFSAIDQLRRKAGAAAGDFNNKLDQRLGSHVIDGLDDFVRNLGDDAVDAGNAQDFGKSVEMARDIWARMSRSQKIDDAIEEAEGYLSGSGSGIKNRFKSILKNPKTRRGFSEAEIKVMQRVATGSIPEQIIIWLVVG